MNSYIQLINKHEGENAFIFGAGPSLWKNMQHPFFKEIPKHGTTIAVNSSVVAVPNFDYWVSNDVLCRRWSYWKDVIEGEGIKVVRSSWEKYKNELKDFLFFNPRPTSEEVIIPGHLGLAYCSSIPSAIDLAIQIGFKKIFLFGVDQNDHDGKHHFWQFMNKARQPVCEPSVQDTWERQQEVFDISRKAFEALRGFAEHNAVDIYNVNRTEEDDENWITRVETFDIISMNQVERIVSEG